MVLIVRTTVIKLRPPQFLHPSYLIFYLTLGIIILFSFQESTDYNPKAEITSQSTNIPKAINPITGESIKQNITNAPQGNKDFIKDFK